MIENNFNKRENPLDQVYILGRFLREKRNSLKITRKKLAIQLNISIGALESYETSVSFPLEDKLPSIAQALDLDLKQLEEKYNISKNARELEKKANTIFRATISRK